MKMWTIWGLAVACLSLVKAESMVAQQLRLAGENGAEIKRFIESARDHHGNLGEQAAAFLVENMPQKDLSTLKKDFLLENLNLAFETREQFPWAKNLPKDIFFNEVLPYASLDETREPWRKEFKQQCSELVKNCKSTSEAAQVINRDFFKLFNVHYNTGRKAPNQSPSESKALGMATCTGLSIIMVDACRSVGVPARIAGIASWTNKRGNHTWVEIYDDGQWLFTGADEYDKNGLNRAWFTGDATKAIAGNLRHAIWATSWKKTGSHFPMVWNHSSKNVPAVDVTHRYAKPAKQASDEGSVFLRLWDKKGGKRIIATITLLKENGKGIQTVTSKAGTADLNDMATIKVLAGTPYDLNFTYAGKTRSTKITPKSHDKNVLDFYWSELDELKALSKEKAHETAKLMTTALRSQNLEERKKEIEAKIVNAAGKKMQYLEQTFGNAEEGHRSLWISMHGGGGAPARVNDQQWQNQIRLYAPKEGIVVAPRAPTNTWNLWHEAHIDDLFQRLIDNMVAVRGVDPNKVYLMGYSAGGDGVYQLAPRMADRFAAASMMAGHPNDANPLGLRNLPFMIFMGGKDSAYDRNKIAAEWGEKLKLLSKADSGGYQHKVTIYKDLGHWMGGKDQEALPWMAGHTRQPWPKKIIWHQNNRTHHRFYWLSVPPGTAKGGQTVQAEVKGQNIEIKTKELTQLTLRLSDEFLNLDQPVTVTVNGVIRFSGTPKRSTQVILDSLRERLDPATAASAHIDLKF